MARYRGLRALDANGTAGGGGAAGGVGSFAVVAWAAVAVLAGGCHASMKPAQEAGACPAETAIMGRGAGSSRVAYRPGDAVPIILGLQGYRFLRVGVRLGPGDRDAVGVEAIAAIEGFAPFRSAENNVRVETVDGQRIAWSVMIMFEPRAVAALVGKRCTLTVRVPGLCDAGVSVDVVLTEQADCVEDLDGSLRCSDGGAPGVEDAGG